MKKATGTGEGTVTYESSEKSVATVNESSGEVTIVGAGITTITANQAVSETHEAGEASYTLTVDKKQLKLETEATVADKVYDGTTDAVLKDSPVLKTGDIVGTDTVNVSAIPVFDSEDVAVSQSTTIKYTINGEEAGNYLAPVQDKSKTAEITAKELKVTGLNATYNPIDEVGKGTVTISGEASLEGVVSSDASNVELDGTAQGKVKGNSANEAVIVTGLSLKGTKAGNYKLALPTDLKVNANQVKKADKFEGSFEARNVTGEFDADRVITFAQEGLGARGIDVAEVAGLKLSTELGTNDIEIKSVEVKDNEIVVTMTKVNFDLLDADTHVSFGVIAKGTAGELADSEAQSYKLSYINGDTAWSLTKAE